MESYIFRIIHNQQLKEASHCSYLKHWTVCLCSPPSSPLPLVTQLALYFSDSRLRFRAYSLSTSPLSLNHGIWLKLKLKFSIH